MACGCSKQVDVGSPAGKAQRSLFWKVEEKVVLLSLNRSASFSLELWQRYWLIFLDPCQRPVDLKTDYLSAMFTKSFQIDNRFNVPIKVVFVKFNSSALE